MKLIDCFTFYNELKMLEFRLTELNDVVDYFILVEACNTFSGNKKELFFEKNKDRYRKFLHKIIHIIVTDMPNTEIPWDNEKHQRRCINRGIKYLNMNKDDLILITDVDEIPDSNLINQIKTSMIKDQKIKTAYSLEMDLYYYNLTCKGSKWYHGKIIPYWQYKEINDCEKIRFLNCNALKMAGWHLSYFGDVNFIKNKINNFSHQEYNKEEYLNEEQIAKQIKNGTDLYNRDNQFKYIDIIKNNYLPKNYKMLL